MNIYKIFFLIFTLIMSNSSVRAGIDLEKPNLEKRWELTGLMTPESVIYDEQNNVLYVSNINGAPLDKDSNGFISRVSLNGELLELKWIEGLNAPKGMSINKGKLYVADIDTLVEIDIATAKISKHYPADDAKFLNDVTINHLGNVFVSDMMTNAIYCLTDNKFSLWLRDDLLNSPNGLLAESDHLVLGTWGVMTDGFATDVPGHMKTINYDSKSINSLGSGAAIGNLDGVEANGDDYLVTDWMTGKLFRVHKNGNADLLLQLEQGMADHEWLADQSLVILPMMNNNALLAYQLAP